MLRISQQQIPSVKMAHVTEASFCFRHFNAEDAEKHIACMPNLIKLDLSHNIIERPPRLPRGLESLNLSFNPRCQSLSGLAMSNLSNLRVLILTNNELTSAAGLLTLPCLEKLDISNNRISNLSGLEVLLRLKVLIMQNNQITNLTTLRSISCSKDLDVLDLRGNPVCDSPNYKMIRNFVVPTLSILDGRRFKARAFALASNTARGSSPEIYASSSKALTAIEQRSAPQKAKLEARQALWKQKQSIINMNPTSPTSLPDSYADSQLRSDVRRGSHGSGSILETPSGEELLQKRPVTGYTAQYLNSTRGMRPGNHLSSTLQHSIEDLPQETLFSQSPIKRPASSSFIVSGTGVASSSSSLSSGIRHGTYASTDAMADIRDKTFFNGNGNPRSAASRAVKLNQDGIVKSTSVIKGHDKDKKKIPAHPRYKDLYINDIAPAARGRSHTKGYNTNLAANPQVRARSSSAGRVGVDGRSRTNTGTTERRIGATYYYDVDSPVITQTRRVDASVIPSEPNTSLQRSPIPWRNAPKIKPRPWRGLHWNESWEDQDKWVPKTSARPDERFVNHDEWIGGKTIEAYSKSASNISSKNPLKSLPNEGRETQGDEAPSLLEQQREHDHIRYTGASPYFNHEGYHSHAHIPQAWLAGVSTNSVLDTSSRSNSHVFKTLEQLAGDHDEFAKPWASRTHVSSAQQIAHSRQAANEKDADSVFDISDMNSANYSFSKNYRNALNPVNGDAYDATGALVGDFIDTEIDAADELDISQLTAISSHVNALPRTVRSSQEYFQEFEDEEGALDVGEFSTDNAESWQAASSSQMKSNRLHPHYANTTFAAIMHRHLGTASEKSTASSVGPNGSTSKQSGSSGVDQNAARNKNSASSESNRNASRGQKLQNDAGHGVRADARNDGSDEDSDFGANVFFAHVIEEPEISITSSHEPREKTPVLLNRRGPGGGDQADEGNINQVLEDLRRQKEQAFTLLKEKLELLKL